MTKLVKLSIFFGAIAAIAALLAIGAGLNKIHSGPALDEFGREGGACYPNKTCDAPNTCFAIRKQLVCERQVTPALVLTADSCFTFQDEQGTHQSCHKSLSECTLHFAATVETKVTIIRGCSS